MRKIKDWINKKTQRVGEFEEKHPFITLLISLPFILFFMGWATYCLLESVLLAEYYSELKGFQHGFNACFDLVFYYIFLSIALELVVGISETISPHIRKWLKIEKRKEKDTE